MPRELSLGNGTLHVMFDAAYQIRDICFPYVSKENHSAGHAFRFGVYTDAQLSWLDSPDWERRLLYEPDTLVTSVRLVNRRLSLSLDCHDAVDFYENIYLKEVVVHNGSGCPRDVLLFFHQDFHISETNIGDTALYDPRLRAIVHYKGRRYFLINTESEGRAGIQDWAIGLKEHNGAEGTWRDAEDGRLERNPIAQGSVDSTVSLKLSLPPAGEATCHYWIAAGTKFKEVKVINSVVADKTSAELIRRTRNYWRFWATKTQTDFADLPDNVIRLYHRSLLILCTLTDSHGGIVAANDSDLLQFSRDTYGYVWPRDAARAAYALTRAGYVDIPRAFFRFCADVLTDEGYLLHKYNPDGSLGSSWHPWFAREQMEIPIQEDETALVLWALWQHFSRHKDVEFIKPLYRSFIIRAADFLEDYRSDRTGLPRPSYDLWEERYGLHTFTVATTYGALQAAANFARCFGETELADRYSKAADELREGARNILYDRSAARFARGFDPVTETLDLTIDASLFGIPAFGLFPAGDTMVASTLGQVEKRLTVHTKVGGLARYERDRFFSVTEDFERVPGNPWIVCTLWSAQNKIASAQTREDLQAPREALAWVAQQARPSGLLPEQLHPFGDRPISVCPLSWSHAEYIITVRDYLEKIHTLGGRTQ